MFKTINGLKELKSTKHEVDVNVVVDATEVCKPVAKLVATFAAIVVAQHVALKLIDAAFPDAPKS